MKTRLALYSRKKKPRSLRVTDRDKRILETIHAFDGMMSLEQIDRLFFSGRGGTWPRERLRALVDHGYLNKPDESNFHRVPLGETIYYLDNKGAEIVAGLNGELAKDFIWRRQPRWSLIAHDLAVNDFRIDVMVAAQASPSLTLHQWIPESEFWSKPDKIEFKTTKGKSKKRMIRPDGFFTIRRPLPNRPGIFEELAFLLEIDMGTEDNPRFAREKVRPGVAYLKSKAYKTRFGVDYGRWLVATTSETRLANMKAQTEQTGGTDLFYFTTFAQASAETILMQPIWHLAGNESRRTVVSTQDPVI